MSVIAMAGELELRVKVYEIFRMESVNPSKVNRAG